MVSREIWVNIFGRVLFEVFEKLTRACYIQIALETMLLPILNTKVIYFVCDSTFIWTDKLNAWLLGYAHTDVVSERFQKRFCPFNRLTPCSHGPKENISNHPMY
jgi:hypothetical protein